MKKLLAIFISLLMVFSVMPMAMVSAETEYSSNVIFDFEDQTGIGKHIGDSGSSYKEIATITDTTFDYWKAIAGNYSAQVNGKGNWASFNLPENWYQYYDSEIDYTLTKPSAITFDITNGTKSKAASLNKVALTIGGENNALDNTKMTELVADGNIKANSKAMATVTYKFPAGLDFSSFTRLAVNIWGTNDPCWVDNITLIFPHAYTATFNGTETAVFDGEVADVTQDFLNGQSSIILPNATLTEGEFAGWATKDDFKTIIPAGTEVALQSDVEYYAVRADKPAHATPAAPTAAEVTGQYVTLNEVEDAVYSMDGITWQDSNVFSGLSAATTYTFYQKLSETLEYAESAVSEGLTVTTLNSYKWNLYSDNFTITENTTSNAKFSTQYSTQGTYFFGTGLAAGQTVTFVSLTDIQPGVYSAKLWARTTGSRAPIDVEINGVKVKSALNTGTQNGMDTAFELDEATVEIAEAGPVTLKLTTTGSGGLYLNALELEKIADYVPGEPGEPAITYDVTIDGEVVATVEEGDTFELPALEAGKKYVGYEVGQVITVTGPVAITTETVSYDITVDGQVVATVDHGATYTLPALEAGKYYVGEPETTFVVTENKEFTTATYTYTITVDGSVVATVDYGTEYTLPQLEAGKYYVDVTDTTFVVTENKEFTTATYTYTITVDGSVVATVDYGTEYTLPALEAGKYYVGEPATTFTVTENKEFTTATYKYDITIDGNVVATVDYGTEYTLPTLPVSKYYVGVTEKTFTVTSDLTFTTANKDAVDSLIVYDADANDRTGTIAMWNNGRVSTHADRKGLRVLKGSSYRGGGVSDVNMFGSFADYADTAIGVRFWAAAVSEGTENPIKVYIGAPKNLADNYVQETLAGETVTVPGTTWTQYTVLFGGDVTAEDIAEMTHIMFVTYDKDIELLVDDVELLVSTDVDASCDITIDGTVVDTVEYNTVYTLPTPETGKYYVETEEEKVVVNGDLAFTTAFYTYTVTIDGQVVVTVPYGSSYALPDLEAGKYYVGYEGVTSIVVTEDVEITTATYEYDITIDGVKVATVAYGDTFVLPAAPDGKQYVDGYTAGEEFVVTSELAFTTEDIPFVAPVVAISMQKGAGVRFNEVTGMRYKATVDTAAVEGYIAEGYTVTMGTLISPADIIGSFDALTFEADENNYLDVVTTGYFNEETGIIAGTISNIREANWGRNYIARSYVKLEKDGEVYVSYATENDNTRSLKSISIAALDDDTADFNTAQTELLEKWAAAADWKK